MPSPSSEYFELLVESFVPAATGGHRGRVHVRPVTGQGIDPTLLVECSREMTDDYPVGTRFLVRAKLSQRLGGSTFVKAPYAFGYSVVA